MADPYFSELNIFLFIRYFLQAKTFTGVLKYKGSHNAYTLFLLLSNILPFSDGCSLLGQQNVEQL